MATPGANTPVTHLPIAPRVPTGLPKGVMITHKNIAAMLAAYVTKNPSIPGDVIISYLPLSHMFGMDLELGCLFAGTSIGYYSGDILSIFDDIKALKPTIFPSVPRLFNKISATLRTYSVDSKGIIGVIARKAIKGKLKKLEKTGSVTHPIWDRLLLNKYKAFFGGRVKYFSTGGAPLAKDVMDFLRVIFSVSFQEGYGQTENTGLGAATIYGDSQSSHVGPPLVS